jgi:ATP-dependent helicase/nuclease subunit B
MVVLAEAVERATRLGQLAVLAEAAGWAGYRRQLRGRFEDWTRRERPVEGSAPDDSQVTAEEWALFGHYRAVLRELRAEDEAGWSIWGSHVLGSNPPAELRKLGSVVAIDPTSLTSANWRLLDYCQRKARSMIVTLPFDHEPSLSELHAGVESIRQRFLTWGFVEEPEPLGGFSYRPKGLDAIESELFRSDSHERTKFTLNAKSGLKILGGPRGEGLGMLVAREVKAHLDRGVPPEEILVLVPRLDEDSERIRETLLAWNLPTDRGGSRRLANVPAVSALRLAMRLSVEDWQASTLVQLLRNGLIRWKDLDQASPSHRFEAAAAIRSTRVFRDRENLRNALERASADEKKKDRTPRIALKAIDQLSEVLDSVVGSGPWSVQVERAQRLAQSLGLEPEELEPLWDALDDQTWVRLGLGPAIAEESWSWREFVAQIETIVSEIDTPAPPIASGNVRIEPVDAIEGARAKVIILANLAEKTFPTPNAVDLDVTATVGAGSADPANLTYSREMLRFARVAGSADDQLVLAYPMTDVNGEPLLPAGFLDDLMRRLDEASTKACVEEHPRFDPILIGHRDLAQADADARVLAVALAAQGREEEPLRTLATLPRHLDALRGTADAFEVAHRRRIEKVFGEYDGRLADASAIAAIRQEFGPEHAFSPSQLESFALCPFQFYQRYVLGLKVVDERRELDEDYAGRGSEVHRVLEQIHEQAAAEEAENLIERLEVLIQTEMRVELEKLDEKESDLPQVLQEINTRRTDKALKRYVCQFRSYFGRPDGEPKPHKFEVAFGQSEDEDDTASHPHLTLGDEPEVVRLQGKIDRIDLVSREDGKTSFRVIDYKTGSNPSNKDVFDGLASQLPLYALAVERLVLSEEGYEFQDAGYWNLREEGFKNVKIKDWVTYRGELITFVLAMVSQLRGGAFPIVSRKPDCRKFCDYHAVCRVGEVRMVGKVWDERPRLKEDE